MVCEGGFQGLVEMGVFLAVGEQNHLVFASRVGEDVSNTEECERRSENRRMSRKTGRVRRCGADGGRSLQPQSHELGFHKSI